MIRRILLLLPLLFLLPSPAVGVGGAKARKRLTELARELRHFMPDKRMDAVRDLEGIASAGAVQLLSDALREEKDWGVQIRTLDALATLGNKRALESVTWACIKGEIILVRRAARKALVACNDGTALRRLGATLSPRDPLGRQYAIEAAADLGGADALKLVQFHFGDRKAEVQVAAAQAAAKLGNPAVVPFLLKLRRVRDPIVHTTAVLSLARFEHEDVYPVIIEELIQTRDDYVTRRLVEIVKGYQTAAFVTAVAGRWPKLRGLGKARLCRLLGSMGGREGAVTLILEALGDRDPLVRADAARALGRARSERAVEPLRAKMTDPSVTVRLMALRSLRTLLPKEKRQEAVMLALENSEPEIRVEAAVIAADEEMKSALRPLGKLVSDEAWEVATAAMISVGRLGHEAEAPVLAPQLQNHDWRYRAAAVEGLFLLRHKSVIPPLIEMVSDPNLNVRSAGVKSLQVLTQQRFGTEPEKWRKWWKGNGAAIEITKKGVVVEGAQKDRYAKDKYLIEILKKARLLVVLGKWDKVQYILDDMDIPYTLIRVQKLKTIGLNPKQLILFNCEGGGGVDRDSTESLRWFVNTGGYVITTDWALQNVVKDVWPGLMAKWEKNTTRNDAVVIEPALPHDPILAGVFDRGLPLKWWLEIQAFAIEILDPFRVDVLVDSLEMLDRYTLSPMLARFSYGHGKVMNSVSHFYLQKEGIANLTTPRERMIFAADHLGLSFAEIRDLADRGFFEKAETTKVTKDYSMFRLIVNFVDEKKRRVEQE